MIKIIAIGKIKEKAMIDVMGEYAKRLQPIHKIEVIELSNSTKKENDIDGIIDDESQRILDKIDSRDFVVLLDLKGKNISSETLSSTIEGVVDQSKTLVFVIGGSHGVNDALRERSNFMWQLSKLTFPHQLVRVLLFEQIYRAFMIMKHHPYHK